MRIGDLPLHPVPGGTFVARPVFDRATIWFGAADHPRFVTGHGEMTPHVGRGFTDPAHAGVCGRSTAPPATSASCCSATP